MNKHILATGFSLFALAGSNAWADHLVAIAGPMTLGAGVQMPPETAR